MTADRKTSAGIPVIVAAICLATILIIAMVILAGGGAVAVHAPVAACPCPAVTAAGIPALPEAPARACLPVVTPADIIPAVPEPLASADLVLSRPPADDRIPYTSRGFDQPVEAAISWWMSPGFMDNTSEFRSYERTTAEGKLAYPEEHRIFFTFIQNELDTAEQQSVLKSDHLLFRGIGPSFAGTVMNTSRYHELSFASTSYDIAIPLGAFGSRGPDGYRNVLVMEREAGEHALYVSEDQREYLIPRGTEWTVVRTLDVENLTVNADFPLYDRATGSASFDHVRLIYLSPAACTRTMVPVTG